MNTHEAIARHAAMSAACREARGYDLEEVLEIVGDIRLGDEGPGSWTRYTCARAEWEPYLAEARAELRPL